MSTCINREGEYGSHKFGTNGAERFTCRRCWVFDEEAAYSALMAAESRLASVEALADEWEGTVYTLPRGYPMSVNEFCRYWFKDPLRAVLGSDARPPGDEHEPCCRCCEGAGSDASCAGPCWDCLGTGHDHPLASDARPPSDTGTTGWHTHGGECVWPDGRCYVCDAEDLYDPPPNNPSARPVLVVDPAEARETIARTLWAGDYDDGLEFDDPTWTADRMRKNYRLRADAVLAALEGNSDG